MVIRLNPIRVKYLFLSVVNVFQIIIIIIQNYWVFGLCPSPAILQTRKPRVSETGSVPVLRWLGEDIVRIFRKSHSQSSVDEGHSPKTLLFWVFTPSSNPFRVNLLLLLLLLLLTQSLQWFGYRKNDREITVQFLAGQEFFSTPLSPHQMEVPARGIWVGTGNLFPK
jgi:hypothetical protein